MKLVELPVSGDMSRSIEILRLALLRDLFIDTALRSLSSVPAADIRRVRTSHAGLTFVDS